MSQLIGAKAKLTELVDLLRTCGGLRIEGTFADPSTDVVTTPISVELSGADLPLLLRNDAELLQAIQHVAAGILRLGPFDADQVCFDASRAKASRTSELEELAKIGIETVRATLQPYRFKPMLSYERRLLHLALAPSGLKSASVGLGYKRSVVLYPEGVSPPVDHARSPERFGQRKNRARAA